jgi:class 3 adenylate cyclase
MPEEMAAQLRAAHERSVITILFCNVSGSTAMAGQHCLTSD